MYWSDEMLWGHLMVVVKFTFYSNQWYGTTVPRKSLWAFEWCLNSLYTCSLLCILCIPYLGGTRFAAATWFNLESCHQNASWFCSGQLRGFCSHRHLVNAVYFQMVMPGDKQEMTYFQEKAASNTRMALEFSLPNINAYLPTKSFFELIYNRYITATIHWMESILNLIIKESSDYFWIR